MKKSSMVLGIIGGVLAILLALLIIAGGVSVSQALPELLESDLGYDTYVEYDYGDLSDFNLIGVFVAGFGGVMLVGGVLGLIGGVVVNKHNVLAGVLMLIGSALCLFTFFSFLSFILLLLGGIFAFVKDSRQPENPAVNPDFE